MGSCSSSSVLKFSSTLVTLIEQLLDSEQASDFTVGKTHLLNMLESIDKYSPKERQKILELVSKLVKKLEE